MDISPEQARSFESDAVAATSSMQKLIDAAAQARSTIRSTALRTFVEAAKVDHLIYKVLSGLSQKSADDFSSHTACRLGKWYYEGDGRGQEKSGCRHGNGMNYHHAHESPHRR